MNASLSLSLLLCRLACQPLPHVLSRDHLARSAGSQRREPADHVAPAQALVQWLAVQPGAHEAGVEAVARAGCIDRCHRNRRGMDDLAARAAASPRPAILDHYQRTKLVQAS